jgi:uncharacterized protein YjeT (DUF2065 family)
MSNHTYGIILIIAGIVYNIKPNIFRVGFWKKTSITQQSFTPKQYNLYMRILGGVFIILGVYMLFVKK